MSKRVVVEGFVEAHVYLPVEFVCEDHGHEDWKYSGKADAIVEAKLKAAFPGWDEKNKAEGCCIGGMYMFMYVKIDGEPIFDRLERLEKKEPDPKTGQVS